MRSRVLYLTAAVAFAGCIVLFAASDALQKKAVELDPELANRHESRYGGAKPYNRIKQAVSQQRS